MSAELMYGQPVADLILDPLKKETLRPKLTVVKFDDAGEDIRSYVAQVRRTAALLTDQLELDIQTLNAEMGIGEFHDVVHALNADKSVTGYMLMQKLPSQLQERFDAVRAWIASEKDMDVQGHGQRGIFGSEKIKGQLLPPTSAAVMRVINHYCGGAQGKKMVIVGDGEIGYQTFQMARNDKAIVTLTNEFISDPTRYTHDADIIVSAVGKPNVITGAMVNDRAAVISVGMSKVNDKWFPDVDMESVEQEAGMLTPFHKGLGPVTVASLMDNVFRAARIQANTR